MLAASAYAQVILTNQFAAGNMWQSKFSATFLIVTNPTPTSITIANTNNLAKTYTIETNIVAQNDWKWAGKTP